MASATLTTKERIEQQVDEIELLESMFSQQGEFSLEDQDALSLAKAFLSGLTTSPPLSLSFTVRLEVGKRTEESGKGALFKVDVCCRLGNNYPGSFPEVYVRSNDLSAQGQDQLNAKLGNFMKEQLSSDDPCLLSVVEWVRENASSYFLSPMVTTVASLASGTKEPQSPSELCHMWLYMHHIYSKTKRRNILSLADELELTGFCLPGKPGVVCVEGSTDRTKQFYAILRRWNWKSITCRKKELIPLASTGCFDKERRFAGFRELSFDTHGHRSNRMDMGQFRDYLTTHGMDHMFKELFGIDCSVPVQIDS